MEQVLKSTRLHVLGEADEPRVVLDLVPNLAAISLSVLLLDFPLELEDAVGALQLAVQDGQQNEVEIGGR